MTELVPLADISDVEVYLKHAVPAALVEFAERKLGASGNVLRLLFRKEGTNLDNEIVEDSLIAALTKDAVAVNVAADVKREESVLDSDVDLSAFSQFTQTAGGYSFTGEWQGSSEDVFFTQNQLSNLGLGQSTISTFLLHTDDEKNPS